jgi:hypothetical protein
MKLANGHWLTPFDYPNIWTDGRGGAASYTIGLVQPTAYPTAGWTPDPAHQPDLAYVPYLLTGSRWYLDRLNAQAAFSLNYDWPGVRCGISSCNLVVNGGDQVRQQAWSLREVMEAGWIGKQATFEKNYFSNSVMANSEWLEGRKAGLNAAQGQAHGWLEGNYGGGAMAPWEQDYFAGVAVLGAEMGYGRIFAQFIQNWSEQRFLDAGMNPHDGCAYNLAAMNSAADAPLTTWSAIEQATMAAGLSNGTGWSQSQGDYCALARAALGGLLTLDPADAGAQKALKWLQQSSGAPYIDQVSFQNDPTFNVVPPN